MGAWFSRKEVDSAAAVGLCCMHNAPVRCHLGFLFHKVMHKYKIGEVGKTKHLIFSITLLPKIIVIGSCMSRL